MRGIVYAALAAVVSWILSMGMGLGPSGVAGGMFGAMLAAVWVFVEARRVAVESRHSAQSLAYNRLWYILTDEQRQKVEEDPAVKAWRDHPPLPAWKTTSEPPDLSTWR